MSSSYRNSLDEWLRQLDVEADRVLDIGGSQLPVKGRTRTWDVKQYQIADLPQPHVNSPKAEIEFDLNYPDLGFFDNDVDLIFCLEVFEYIYNPMTAMNTISKYLAKDGSAWVTFPSFYPLHQPVEDDALRYMPAGIEKLAKTAGLTIQQMIKRKPETDLLKQFWSAERMRMAKNEDHDFTGFIVELKK